MRDENRIQPILAALSAYWWQHPDMRLGQIIENATQLINTGGGVDDGPLYFDAFYVEDDVMLVALRKMANEGR